MPSEIFSRLFGKKSGNPSKSKGAKPAKPAKPAAAPTTSSLPAAVRCNCPCDLSLQITHGERVAGILAILRLSSLVSTHAGVPLMEPYIFGGSMVSPSVGHATPITTYISTSLDAHYCPADDRPTTHLKLVCEEGTAPHWCEGGSAICVMDWTNRCSTPIKARRPIGHDVGLLPTVKAAIDFLRKERVRSPRVLAIGHSTSSATWYKFNGNARPSTPLDPRLSQPMRTMAERVLASFVGPRGCGTSGAVMRIAYRAGAKANVSTTLEQCSRTMASLNRAVMSRMTPPDGRCAHFLATDWFVSADGKGSSGYNQALLTCWRRSMVASAPTWWWPSTDPNQYSVMLYPATSALPPLERAMAGDPAGFRVFFDIAILASVEHCYEKSHMGGMIVGQLRVGEKRSGCTPIGKLPS